MRYSTIILSLSLCVTAVAQSPGTFVLTGSMSTARAGHTATLLTNGKVLISGGWVSPAIGLSAVPTNTAEIYDPATGTFRPTGPMNVARMWHSATLLPDGRVLIAGGEPPNSYVTASAEIYDPSTEVFTPTSDMAQGLICHQATLLGNGKVLITAGSSQTTTPIVAQLYDPVAGAFTSAGPYANYPGGTNNCQGGTTLLADGRVLLVWESDGAEIYDPVAGSFRGLLSTLPVGLGDGMPTGNLLMNGKVLIAGGESDQGPQSGAALYDASSGTFTETASLTQPHAYATSSLLPDGSVLIAGSSWSDTLVTPNVDLFRADSATFVGAADMLVPRSSHTATLLPNGGVLMAGGCTSSYGFQTTASAEIYYPAVLVSSPVLYSIPGAAPNQGAILHAGTSRLLTASDPAVPGESVEIYGAGLTEGGAIPPLVAIGGRPAQVLYFGDAPGYPGLNQIDVRVPGGIASGPSVPLRLDYLSRPSNEVTLAVR